jgi:cytochrome c biogenesis protein ResB
VQKFWKKLKSITLAITLISILAAGSLLATLIPQGKASEEYFKLYPKIVAELVVQTGLGRFFSSILFLIPALLFFVNLGACTIDRLLRELRKKGKHRHGPDILHVGLLVLVVGSLVSFSGRQEGTVRLAAGDSVELPGGEVLHLVKFTDERYDDGRPKDWTSVVNLEKEGKVVVEGREIRVNSPLRVGDVTLYQSSYSADLGLTVTTPGGAVTELSRGESYEDTKLSVFFMTTEADPAEDSGARAVLRVKSAGQNGAVRAGSAPVDIDGYKVATKAILSTGLQAVRDPGYPLVLAALILIGAGTALTFFQKLKDVNE